MYKEDLALNNQQWLISHKTKPNQTKFIFHFCLSKKPTVLILYKYTLEMGTGRDFIHFHILHPYIIQAMIVYLFFLGHHSTNLFRLVLVINFHHFVYLDNCLHFYFCIHNVLADTSFSLLQVFHAKFRSLYKSPLFNSWWIEC